MILFITLLALLLIASIVVFIVGGTGVVLFVLLFGDLIVFIWIMTAICRRLFK